MKIYIATPTLSSEVRIILTRNEFIKIVDAGNDVMFDFRGKKFSIVMTKCGADIAEQKTCANRQSFESAAQLLDQYKVDGIALANALPECRFTFIS